MGGVTSALQHLSEFEFSIRLKQTTGREQRRWLVIWNALIERRPGAEIALDTDVSVSTVHNVISQYNRFGPEAIEGCERGIRRRCHLSKDEDAEFLKPLLEIAFAGELATGERTTDYSWIKEVFSKPAGDESLWKRQFGKVSED